MTLPPMFIQFMVGAALGPAAHAVWEHVTADGTSPTEDERVRVGLLRAWLKLFLNLCFLVFAIATGLVLNNKPVTVLGVLVTAACCAVTGVAVHSAMPRLLRRFG